MNDATNNVTVIGLGPMGQGMAIAYLNKGYQVTVWNRTPGRAATLVTKGAILAPTLPNALKASELIILSLTDYQAMYEILEPYTHSLNGKVLANLSSDTPEKVRKAAQWANGCGADFIAGGIMVPPPLIGKTGPHVYTFYSGNKRVFDQYQRVLEIMTATDYRGEDPGLAMLYYQALLDFMYTTIAGALHAYALIGSAGITARTFAPYVDNFLAFLPDLVRDSNMPHEIDNRQYNGEENSLQMMAAGTAHVVQASRDAGIHAALPDVVREIYEHAVAKGYGKDGINSIIEVLRKPSA